MSDQYLPVPGTLFMHEILGRCAVLLIEKCLMSTENSLVTKRYICGQW